MKKKINTYQKLKAENLKLKRDIYTLIRYEKSKEVDKFMEYFKVKVAYNMQFDLEDNIWN